MTPENRSRSSELRVPTVLNQDSQGFPNGLVHYSGGKQFGFDDEVLKYLGQQRATWQNKLVDIRNKVIQHTRIPAEAVSVVYRSSTAKVYFDNCWQVAEWFRHCVTIR